MKITYPKTSIIPEKITVNSNTESRILERSTRFYLPEGIADGFVETLEVKEGMLLTQSDFSFREDTQLKDEYSDQEIFQLSFCLDGEAKWVYKNQQTEQFFRVGAQESQVRYGKIQECMSWFYGGVRCRTISITLDAKKFEAVLSCIKARDALSDTAVNEVAKVYTYTPNISKILAEITGCSFDDDLKRIYLEGKILELIAVYCAEVICRSPANVFGIQISTEDYEALLRARELINQKYAHPLTIAVIAKEALISEQKLKIGFKRCFDLTVNDYIVEKRMEMAQKLLLAGQHKVRDIAWMVGYSHTGYFINVFRKHYGLTPGEMLKNNK